MCGIVGIFDIHGKPNAKKCEAMLETIKHRGPDFSKVISQPLASFGHARLAIQDLSVDAHQPFYDEHQGNLLVFNGEIYNHWQVRQEIEKSIGCQKWVTTSDTETLFKALGLKGVEWTLENIDGMFAFAFYSLHRDELILARDRYGEKPLHYSIDGHRLIFASELKAFAASDINLDLDDLAQDRFIEFGFIHEPLTIYKNIKKLRKGHYIKLKVSNFQLQEKSYTDFQNKNVDYLSKSSYMMTLDNFTKKMEHAVDSRLLSDVPVASFLSGGYDSTLITAIMSKLSSNNKPETFSIGFDDYDFDESRYAERVAKYLGTQHHTFSIETNDVSNIVFDAISVHDEPFADASQIPFYFLCKNVSQTHKVAITGDGGDEFFGGYRRHFASNKLRKYNAIFQNLTFGKDLPVRQLASHTPNWLLTRIEQLTGVSELREKLLKAAVIIDDTDVEALYFQLLSYGLCKDTKPFSKIDDLNEVGDQNLTRKFMLLDQEFYLPDNIFVKSDRASMLFGLECRAPFLERNIVNFSQTLPEKYLVQKSKGKILVKELTHKLVPKEIMERPKAGFTPPLEKWFKTDLKYWILKTLQRGLLVEEFQHLRHKIELCIDDLGRETPTHTYLAWKLFILLEWNKYRRITN